MEIHLQRSEKPKPPFYEVAIALLSEGGKLEPPFQEVDISIRKGGKLEPPLVSARVVNKHLTKGGSNVGRNFHLNAMRVENAI